MFEILQYSFILRGLEAGLIIAIIAPLIGIFLVLRRYSLIADTLAHVSLAGVAFGVILKIDPIITAILTALTSSLVIEKLRLSKKVYGESALAIFLSGSLAVAIVILSFAHGLSVNIFNYLFGSIVTVTQTDVYLIGVVGILVLMTVMYFYRQLIFISFDEEAAQVAGINTKKLNIVLISLAALTVALAIPIVGVLLISALVVIPVVSALQWNMSFTRTLCIAEVISIFSVISGIFISFYADLSTGGTIVLLTIFCFLVSFFFNAGRK